jgi:1,4-dihydroxy-2-naphthoate octaprenyltransferase
MTNSNPTPSFLKLNSFKPIQWWMAAFRLKTLPLALSNTIMGSALAASNAKFRWDIFWLAAVTTILLQLISNLANDYGDFVNGKDTAERIGPKRMVQAGHISPKSMLKGIIIIGMATIISGVLLILTGTAGLNISIATIFGLLGTAAIVAAIKYTTGKNPYGYRGLGDIFVFIFFGLVGVIGTYFLHSQSFYWELILPASAMGLLCTGVLNMNNLRDYEADKNAGKKTIVVYMGTSKAKVYQLILISGAMILACVYTILNYESHFQWLFLLSFPVLLMNIKTVFTYKKSIELYPELAKLALGTLLFALSFGMGLLL